ncbi:hypothetical protein NB689_003303 [Xanthomonas sacchari]|nr:hypothetical protein [Xanthomonas sacchari]
MGGRAADQPAHGPGAGDHAGRPARRRRVQQRIRPAQPARLFPQLRAAGDPGPDPRLRQADHAGRRPGRDRSRAGGEDPAAARRCGDRARRPGDADRPGRRRGQFGGLRRQRRGPGFRQRAARQPGDGAARAGGHRPLRGAGCGQPDPLVPRRRRRRPVQRHSRTAARFQRRRPHRPGPRAQRRPVAVADAAVVQRIAGALRARRAAGAPGRIRRDLRARALPVCRCGRGDRRGTARRGVRGARRWEWRIGNREW